MITVFGSYVIDNVATMKRFPEAGETIIGYQLKKYLGGKGVNQCVACAKMGKPTAMVGMLGDDEGPTKFFPVLDELGVDHSCTFITDKEGTACAQIQINDDGQNRIAVIPGSNFCFGDEEFEKSKPLLLKSDYVIMQLELTFDIIWKAIRFCKENGIKVVLNPAPAAPIPDDILNGLDFIVPNETELSLASGMPANDIAETKIACETLLKKGVKHVITTLGSKGALIVDQDGSRIVKPYHVKAIDTVAAGDSFIGAFTYCLSEGKTVEEAVAFANGMGALTVTVKGAIPSLHTKAEVEEFIAANGPCAIERL